MPDTTNIQTGHGATFVTGAFSGQVTGITPGAQSREVIPTTYLGSSGAHTKIYGDLVTNEPWSIEFQYVAGTNEPGIASTAASATFTFPDSGGDWSAGATLAGQGFFSSWTPGEITTDQLMTASATWEWSGVVTFTSATT